MRQSLECLKQLRSCGCEISVAACSALCQDGRRWQDAISVESAPDVAFYGEVLGGVTWLKALLLLAANAKLQLNSVTYSTAVRTCRRRQDVIEVVCCFARDGHETYKVESIEFACEPRMG